MKKIFKYLFGILGLILILTLLMSVFHICPPAGPWPTPPWCGAKSFEKIIYRIDVKAERLDQVKSVNMSDTWGRNYNMGMVETTQANIKSSFDRVRDMGTKEVFVHDFSRAVYKGDTDFKSLNYKIVNETFWNDFRDESMSKRDLSILAKEAHARGLLLGIKHNMSFVDIGKYIKEGISGSGDIDKSVAKDRDAFNESHTKEWIEDYFSKWQSRMIERATMYQKAGVDIMSVSPSFMAPSFAHNEELANTLYKNLIGEVRKVFKGKIYAEVDLYGLLDGNNRDEDWNKYDYYKDADIKEVRVYNLPTKYQTKDASNRESVKIAIEKLVKDLDAKAGEKGIKLSVFFAPSSYENAINLGPVEVLDKNNQMIKNLKVDFDGQMNSFEYMLESLKNTKNIERINVGNFAWDDALDGDVGPRISINATFRNKPSEELIKTWFSK